MQFNFIKNIFKTKFTIEFLYYSESLANSYFNDNELFFKNKDMNIQCKESFISAELALRFICNKICVHLHNCNNREQLTISLCKGKRYFATIFYNPISGILNCYGIDPNRPYERLNTSVGYKCNVNDLITDIPKLEYPLEMEFNAEQIIEQMLSQDIIKWENVFDVLSKATIKTCGGYFEVYQRRLSSEIDKILVKQKIIGNDRDIIIKMAQELFDYRSASEIEEDIERDKQNGFCSHGTEPGYCPLGCGED